VKTGQTVSLGPEIDPNAATTEAVAVKEKEKTPE